MKTKLLALLLCCPLIANAADKIKIGFISTLSGPSSALGIDIRDGFNLALKHAGGKFGGLPTEVILADDQQSPDIGKQATERMLKKEKADILTGIVFSNVLLAVAPSVFQAQTIYISPNTGPSDLAGEKCNPNFFNVAWQNEDLHGAMGKHMSDKGFKKVLVLAPNYPGGKDSIAGFKRNYKGEIASEIWTKLGQLDYAAEIAQVRATKPEAIYIFLPGGMGINFIKQYNQSGLNKQIPLYMSGFSADEDMIRAVGEQLVGLYNSSQWNKDIANEQNTRFVADFQKEYGRMPSLYASQGYDAGALLDAAVREVKGKVEDKEALRNALRAAHFKSVRGAFKFNNNQFPVQSVYLRQVVKEADGKIGNKIIAPIWENHGDAYAGQCKMN
jgi:branched-chain amino acid transport system substrate-binding protein